jgi:microcystin-dependent protein
LFTATANNTPALLSLGTDGQVLIADPSTVGNTRGIKWGQITADGIASDAVTTAKILDANVTLTKLATAVQNLLIPAGTIAATVKATADAGWQFMGQTLTNAEGLYPALFAAAPVSWRTGTAPNRNLVLPSMTDRTLFQAGTTTLGATGGLNTATLGVSNLPAHTHTASSSSSSSSTVTDPTHRHEEAGRENGATVAGKYLQRYGGSGSNYDVVGTNTTRWDSITNPQTTYASTGITVTTSTSTSTTVSGGGNGTSTGNAFATTNAHLAVNYQIKAH